MTARSYDQAKAIIPRSFVRSTVKMWRPGDGSNIVFRQTYTLVKINRYRLVRWYTLGHAGTVVHLIRTIPGAILRDRNG